MSENQPSIKHSQLGETHCAQCGGWCCRYAAVYASPKELARLGVDQIQMDENGKCQFITELGCCAYTYRPFDCRILPYNIETVNSKLYWFVYTACSANRELDHFAEIANLEHRLFPFITAKYLYDSVAYYSGSKWKILELEKLRAINETLLGEKHEVIPPDCAAAKSLNSITN